MTLSPIDAGSGVAQDEYRVDGGFWRRGTSVAFAAPADGANDGRHTLEYRSIDRAFNIEETQSVEVRIDTQAPVTSDNYDGAPHLVFDMVLTPFDPPPLTVPDTEPSGVDHTEYRIDYGEWQTGPTCRLQRAIRHKLAGLTYGYHWFEYRSVDVAGNFESISGLTVEVGEP